MPYPPGWTMERMPSSPLPYALAMLGALSSSPVPRASAPFRLVLRSRIVLLGAASTANRVIAERLGICEDTAASGSAGTASRHRGTVRRAAPRQAARVPGSPKPGLAAQQPACSRRSPAPRPVCPWRPGCPSWSSACPAYLGGHCIGQGRGVHRPALWCPFRIPVCPGTVLTASLTGAAAPTSPAAASTPPMTHRIPGRPAARGSPLPTARRTGPLGRLPLRIVMQCLHESAPPPSARPTATADKMLPHLAVRRTCKPGQGHPSGKDHRLARWHSMGKTVKRDERRRISRQKA